MTLPLTDVPATGFSADGPGDYASALGGGEKDRDTPSSATLKLK